jgi:hypothetical protein
MPTPSVQNTMPLLALSQSLLPLLQGAEGVEPGPFHLNPWSSPVWRENFGLVPLRSVDGDPQDDDVDYDDYQAEWADAADGFALSKDAVSAIRRAQLPSVSDHAVLKAASFFESFFIDCVCPAIHQNQSAKSAIVKPQTRTYFEDFRELVLTMLGRPGGVMAIVQEVMTDRGATPEHAWKDAREANRVSPISSSAITLRFLTSALRRSQSVVA